MSRAGQRYVSIAFVLISIIPLYYWMFSYHHTLTHHDLRDSAPQLAERRRLVTNISCLKLFEADERELHEAKQFISTMPPPPKDKDFKIPADCGVLRGWGYQLETRSEEERNFPLAISILMHQNVHQLEFLLRVIYQPQNFYCIHIDKKASQIVHDSVKAIVKCFPNIFIASDLVKIDYGWFSRLQADINCMTDLVNKHAGWKYLINIASSALPLRTNAELVKILQVYNGSNDIEGGTAGGWLNSVRYSNNSRINTLNVVPPPPHKIQILKGSAYGVYSRAFMEFVIKGKEAQDLLTWFKDHKGIYSPDEHYWASLHHLKYNPQLKTPGGFLGEPNAKPWLASYSAWCYQDSCLGTWGPHAICLFGVGDLPTLANRKELFANKFEPSLDRLAGMCLQELLLNRSRTAAPMHDWFYYFEQPFSNNEHKQHKGC